MKKIISFTVMLLLITLFAVGCDSKSSGGKDNKPSIESQVVYDKDGLKITAEKLTYLKNKDVLIDYSFENSTEKDYIVRQLDYIVDGYYVDIPDYGSVGALAGESNSGSFQFTPYNAYEFAEIQVAFEISEYDTDYSFETEYATVKTSLYGKTVSKPLEDGIEIYNSQGAYIAYKFEKATDSDVAKIIFLYDNTSESILYAEGSVFVNGEEYYSCLGDYFDPGEKCVTAYKFDANELERWGLESFDDVEKLQFDFHIWHDDFPSDDEIVHTELFNIPLE